MVYRDDDRMTRRIRRKQERAFKRAYLAQQRQAKKDARKRKLKFYGLVAGVSMAGHALFDLIRYLLT